jgi:hypothetical protein
MITHKNHKSIEKTKKYLACNKKMKDARKTDQKNI